MTQLEALLTLMKFARNFTERESYASFHFNFAQYCHKQIIMIQHQIQLPNLISMQEESWNTLKVCVKFTLEKLFFVSIKLKLLDIQNQIHILIIQIVKWTMIYQLNSLKMTIHQLILDKESLLINHGKLIRKDPLTQSLLKVVLFLLIMPQLQTLK